MKTPSRILAVFSMLLFLLGCYGTPKYTGEGKIINTARWEDDIVRVPEYTIELASFSLSTNVQGNFSLGSISFFRRTAFTIFLRFTDDHPWRKYSESGSSAQLRRAYKNSGTKDIDKVQARWTCRVDVENGEEIIKFDKPIKDCVWSGLHLKGSLHRIDIYDRANADKETPAGKNLTFSFSFSGDPTLTNHAELVVVVCRSK